MPESLIPIAEIAQFIIGLQRDVRSLKQKFRIMDKEFELGSSEEPQDVGGQLPATAADYKTPVTEVTTIVNETTILVKRQIPDAGGQGWKDDPELTTTLEITLPTGVSPPDVGRIIQPVYTGLFQINTLGNTLSLPRYGLFAADVSAIEMSIQSVQEDHLVCRTLTSSEVLGTEDINVLKPWTLRKTPFDGKTVDGVSYVYTNNIERVADGTTTFLITPNYFVGAHILVRKQNNFLVISEKKVSLIDINNDSRSWAKDPSA